MTTSNSNTRETILAVAAGLYAGRGYDGVSMRDVAAAVGVGPANLYHHFKDKDALIRETLSWVFSRQAASLEALLAGDGGPLDKLRDMIGWFVHTLHDDPVFARLTLRELLDGSPERREFLARTVFSRPFSLITATVAQCSDRFDPVLAAMSVAALIQGHYQLADCLNYLPGGRPEHADPDVLVGHVTAMLGYALGVGNGVEERRTS